MTGKLTSLNPPKELVAPSTLKVGKGVIYPSGRVLIRLSTDGFLEREPDGCLALLTLAAIRRYEPTEPINSGSQFAITLD